jgi:pimeloyl-ACP methyl ester carboxylesterase
MPAAPQSGVAPVEDGALRFTRAGDGPPMVYTHPYAMPRAGAPAIEGLCVVSVWPRGFVGSSPVRHPADHWLDRLAADLEDVRRHLALDRLTLWGLSMGGFVALTYACRYPSAVRALLLDSTAPSHEYAGDPESIWPALGASDEARRYAGERSADNRAAYFAKMGDLQRALDPAYEPPRDLEVNDGALAYLVRNLGAYDVRPRLPEIAAPALVLAGGRDGQCRPLQSRIIADLLPRARLEYFPDLGHGIIRNDRPEVIRLVRDFVLEHQEP